MAEIITSGDLPVALQSAETIGAMVAGANAKASRVAPCLTWDGTEVGKPAPSADQLAEAKLILIGAVKRWAEAGAGALSTQSAGPFSMGIDTRQRTGFNLWPSEITDLQAICATGPTGRQAFSIDTAPVHVAHQPWCNLSFGAAYCSCGADLTNYQYPLYEY